jgi:hypothetical protein
MLEWPQDTCSHTGTIRTDPAPHRSETIYRGEPPGYVIIGGYQGKFDTKIEGNNQLFQNLDYIDDDVEKFLDLKNQVIQRYVQK